MKYLLSFLFVSSILVLVYLSISGKPMNTQLSETTNNRQVVQNDAESSQNSSSYVDYSESQFSQMSDKKRILFFHASWCPTCKVANKDLVDNLGLIPEEVVIFKTDYDRESSLKSKYGVTYQHTFVLVDNEDNAVLKWNGGGVDEIIANINK